MIRLITILSMLCMTVFYTYSQELKILSLNNSLIDFNNQPEMFNDIAESEGIDAVWTKRTQLGRTLLFHYNDPLSKQMVSSAPWDVIILQEQSSLPRNHPEILMESIKLWKLFIMENFPNKEATIILPMNWAYSTEWDKYPTETKKLRESYEAVARDIPGVKICYIGQAYQSILDNKGKEKAASLYSDDRHPTPLATYLAACMEFSMITGKKATEIKYVPEGITEEDARMMRNIAAQNIK